MLLSNGRWASLVSSNNQSVRALQGGDFDSAEMIIRNILRSIQQIMEQNLEERPVPETSISSSLENLRITFSRIEITSPISCYALIYPVAREISWESAAPVDHHGVFKEELLWLAGVVIYNLALAYHIHAKQARTHCSETRYLLAAQSLYKHAYGIIATFPGKIQLRDLPRILGIWINLSNVHDELGDRRNAHVCWGQFHRHLMLAGDDPYEHEQMVRLGLQILVASGSIFYREDSAPAA